MNFPIDFSKIDLSQVMGMAQKLKENMARMENSLSSITVESSVGGGMVKVKANARGDILSIELDPELLAMDDRAVAQGLLVSGVNQALADARARREEEMRKMTGGLMLPGIF